MLYTEKLRDQIPALRMKETKRILCMHHSKETVNFVEDLVSTYAKYDKFIERYDLNLCDIPDFELHKFAGLLLNDWHKDASEATSCDNSEFDRTMLPSLIQFLRDTTDEEREADFVVAWRDGVTKYFERTMQYLIEEYCAYYEG